MRRRIALRHDLGTDYWWDIDQVLWLCDRELRELYDFPDNAKRIDLVVSDKPVRGAVVLKYMPGEPCDVRVDGRVRPVMLALWHTVRQAGTAWAWIEY